MFFLFFIANVKFSIWIWQENETEAPDETN